MKFPIALLMSSLFATGLSLPGDTPTVAEVQPITPVVDAVDGAPTDALHGLDGSVTIMSSSCYNSGVWAPVSNAFDAAISFCDTSSGQSVWSDLIKKYTVYKSDGTTDVINVGYVNTHGNKVDGWPIRRDECINWLYEIILVCTPNGRYDLQGGVFYTSSGYVFLDPNDN